MEDMIFNPHVTFGRSSRIGSLWKQTEGGTIDTSSCCINSYSLSISCSIDSS